MTRRRIGVLAAMAVASLTAFVVAGCGGNNNDATGSTAPPKTADGHSATIGMAKNGSLGNILVDSQGHTLYLFKKDTGTKSMCSGECANDWPPLTANGKPTVGTGLDAAKVATSTRSDGTSQVTYNGHPLYRYEADTKQGDVNGQGLNVFGAVWWAVDTSGSAVTASADSTGSGGGSNVGGY
jgi:predicted lipoprotein with Yx(FWY)xxD motif